MSLKLFTWWWFVFKESYVMHDIPRLVDRSPKYCSQHLLNPCIYVSRYGYETQMTRAGETENKIRADTALLHCRPPDPSISPELSSQEYLEDVCCGSNVYMVVILIDGT